MYNVNYQYNVYNTNNTAQHTNLSPARLIKHVTEDSRLPE
jgi:hypothetical protein